MTNNFPPKSIFESFGNLLNFQYFGVFFSFWGAGVYYRWPWEKKNRKQWAWTWWSRGGGLISKPMTSSHIFESRQKVDFTTIEICVIHPPLPNWGDFLFKAWRHRHSSDFHTRRRPSPFFFFLGGWFISSVHDSASLDPTVMECGRVAVQSVKSDYSACCSRCFRLCWNTSQVPEVARGVDFRIQSSARKFQLLLLCNRFRECTCCSLYFIRCSGHL